jgi:hypothetical protein
MTVVIVSLIAIAIALVVWTKVRVKQKNALSQLPSELREMKSGKTVSGEHDGIAYEVYYFAGGKTAPPHLALRVACKSEGRFIIAEESGFDRFFKRYGITNEIQVLDKAFDDAYFIQSETVDFVRQFFQPPEKRRAIQELFELQYTVVEHDGKTMKAVCSPFRLQNERPPDFVTGAVTRLAALAKDVPQVPLTPSIDMGAWKTKRNVAFAVPILGLLAGAAFWVLGFVRYPPLDSLSVFLDSLKLSLPLLLVFLWLAVKLIRGRSTSHHELLAVGILALFAFPISGMGTETFFNGWLDRSPSSPHTVDVLDKYVSRSGKTTDYILVLQSWRPGRQTEKLEVSSRTHQRVTPNQTQIYIETKPGHFGFEWRVSYKIE